MPDRIIIPTPAALAKYNLNRFVGSNSFNGEKNNPFVTVAGKPSVEEGDYDEDFNYFMNEVILEAYEYQPVRVTTKPVNGMVQASLDYGGGGIPPLLASFRLLLDNDKNIKIEYQHSWEKSQKDLLTGLFGAVDKGFNNLAYGATQASNAAARLGNAGEFVSTPIKKIDYQKIYQSSTVPNTTVQFTAFTNDNFIGDVYLPIMALCAFTHPKRYTGEKDESSSEEASKWDKLLKGVRNVLGATTEIAADASQAINETLALTARQYTLKPPCLFNLYHQSGLYSYSNCMCKSFSVEYEGPWYNATAPEQQIFDVLSTGPMKLNVNRRSFPSIARVTMVFEPNEILTRDDFHFIAGSFSSIANSGNTTFTKFGNP
jgi:hypothetical protein